jgi:hypothetical protein
MRSKFWCLTREGSNINLGGKEGTNNYGFGKDGIYRLMKKTEEKQEGNVKEKWKQKQEK